MTVQIDIKRTGFPVKLGEMELWFDSSIENLKNFINLEEVALKKIKEAKDKAKHIHFPADINADNVHDIDTEKIEKAFDINKETIAAQYDVVFGEGTFQKIYKKYPDIMALESAMDPLFNAIANRIEELEIERQSAVKNKQNEYLAKIKSKHTKK